MIITEMDNVVDFEIVDINRCESMRGKVDITTIDDDEPYMVTSSSEIDVVDWDTILQYLWDYQDEKVVKMINGQILKINMEA